MIELSHQFAVMVVEKQSSHISNLYLKAKMSIYYVRFSLHHLSIKRQKMYFSKYTLGNFDILQFKVKQYILNILGYWTEIALLCSAFSPRFEFFTTISYCFKEIFATLLFSSLGLRAFRLKKLSLGLFKAYETVCMYRRAKNTRRK